MNDFEEKNYFSHPLDNLESPFFSEELFIDESDWTTRMITPESPFLNVFEPNQTSFISPQEMDNESIQESQFAWEGEELYKGEEATDERESLADLENTDEALYTEVAFNLEVEEEQDFNLEADQTLEEELLFSQENWGSPIEQGEESLYDQEGFFDDEMLMESEVPLPMLAPGIVAQQVQKLLDENKFDRTLLERFAFGKIWNEDHIALEILYHQQPKLRPAQLDTVSDPKRLELLNWQAVKHQHVLTPIREGIVRSIFGDPANFQIGPTGECQIQDLRQQVLKLGPLPAGIYNGKPYYKRNASGSPRNVSKVNCIVIHHMAYNIGNNVNSYLKVGAQYIVTADGQIAQLYDDLDYLNSSNNFNPRCVSIEFAGNFPTQTYHWWKSKERTIPDRCYITPAQIRAGRCLLSTIKARLPGIKYLYAHRQSSDSRENDPGRDAWFNIAEWALSNLNLTDREPKPFEGTGKAIPDAWRTNRSTVSKLPSQPSSTITPTKTPTKPSAELVRFVQQVLNATEGERLVVDGDFGKFTSAALERFRQKYALGSSGALDEKTQLALAQRVLEELKQQSMFPQFGVMDARTREELAFFKSSHLLGTDAIIDAATRAALADAIIRRTSTVGGAAPISTPQAVMPTNKELVVTADSLNVRSSPSLQGKIIGSLKKDQLVRQLDSSPDRQWYKIQKDSLIGWSFHQYLATRTAAGPLDQILQTAAQSAIARYFWHDRGVAPRGYIKGMALVYARVYCKFKAGDAAAVEMAKADTGNIEKDALARYALEFRSLRMDNSSVGANTLRHLFVLLVGLGMRESGGRYCTGRDRSAQNTSADTAEAGLFQASYNLRTAHPLLPKLFSQYLSNPVGFLDIFQEGVRCNPADLENFGVGNGKDFQRLSKSCPAFAAEFAAVGLRNRCRHWGPIIRKGAEIRPECDEMLLQVQRLVDDLNICPLLT